MHKHYYSGRVHSTLYYKLRFLGGRREKGGEMLFSGIKKKKGLYDLSYLNYLDFVEKELSNCSDSSLFIHMLLN